MKLEVLKGEKVLEIIKHEINFESDRSQQSLNMTFEIQNIK